VPDRSELYAIDFPSGEKLGKQSSPSEEVSCTS
jgi:hypothetical protein